MEFLRSLPLPRRLASRVWLLTLPSAILSFERRQGVPRLPFGRGRLLGLPVIGAGVGLIAWARRNPGARISCPRRPEAHTCPLAEKPAVLGGVVALGGAAILLRSALLAAYSVLAGVATCTDTVSLDEPNLPGDGQD